MTAEKLITSLQNARIKKLVTLQQKSSERRKTGLFVVEGVREVSHCVNAGFRIDSLFFCPEIMRNNPEAAHLPGLLRQTDGYQVTKEVYDKMAYRGGTEGVMAVVEARRKTLQDLRLPSSPLLVVLESVEKPGNLGAVLRSADAAAADAVIVCDPLTDLYNPNLIRSSIGSAFTIPLVACSSEECIAFLKAKGIRILTAQLQDSRLYYDTDMTRGTALVMGTEATGLTNLWRAAADAHIRIPMLGQLDSLNVSVSTAILLFEAVRQRNEIGEFVRQSRRI